MTTAATPAGPAAPIAVRDVSGARSSRRLVLRTLTAVPRVTVPAAALSITHQIGEALVPVLMGIAIDRAVSSGDPAQLVLWLVVLAADFALLSVSYRYGSRLAVTAAQAVEHRLRMAVSDRAMDRRAADETVRRPGAALSLATSDAARLAGAVELAVFPVGQAAGVLFAAAVLVAISWPIGVGVIVGSLLVLWLTERAGRPLHRRSAAEQEAAAAASASAADLMAGYRVVRGLGAEGPAAARYRRASRDALARTLRARRAEGGLAMLSQASGGILVAGIALATALAAVGGQLSVSAFIAVVGLAQFLLSPLQALTREVGAVWATATASAERLLPLLHAPAEPADEDTSADPPAGRCSTGSAMLVLDGVPLEGSDPLSLRVGAGEVVVLQADARHTDAVIAALGGTAGIRSVLLAPHEADLFAGTVSENVALEDADAAAVAVAVHAADLDHGLPSGLQTPVGERGRLLSGGQRQRVALARALARRAPVLVLNEPTSAVDAATEARIAARLRDARADGATLVITRSGAFRAVADRVVRISGTQERR